MISLSEENYLKAIFHLADKENILKSNEPFDILYHIEENHWNGNTTIQLKIIDIRLSVAEDK
mgnify:CR=1 FL=1